MAPVNVAVRPARSVAFALAVVIGIVAPRTPLHAGQIPVELRERAEQGDAEAQNELGSRYYEGRGVPRDYAEAETWVRRAADQGHARGQYNLGLMYFRGRGVAQNEAEAVKWYRRAAEQGFVAAQVGLGYMYEYGAGVPQDLVLAHMWVSLGAAGSTDGVVSRLYSQKRDEIAQRMLPEQIAEAQRLAAEWKPIAGR